MEGKAKTLINICSGLNIIPQYYLFRKMSIPENVIYDSAYSWKYSLQITSIQGFNHSEIPNIVTEFVCHQAQMQYYLHITFFLF